MQIVESGEPREVHHFCLMTGFGADGVNPYMVFEAMAKIKKESASVPAALTVEKLNYNYKKSVRLLFSPPLPLILIFVMVLICVRLGGSWARACSR